MRKLSSADNRSTPSRNLDEKNKKNEFFPVLDRFRALRESWAAGSELSQFFDSRETRAI